MKYTVTIYGCGSIGALKPDEFDSPSGDNILAINNILTIAHAVSDHPRTALLDFQDTDSEKRKAAYRKWLPDDSIIEGDAISETDIAVIASPTETHLEIFEKLIKHENCPTVILLEKPAGSNLDDINKMMELIYKEGRKDLKIAVNYTRRFLPTIKWLKKYLENKDIYSCTGYYNNGLLRDGCHAVDLMRYLFGNIKDSFQIQGREIFDRSQDDPSVPVQLITERCSNVFLLPVDGRRLSVFEFTIITDEGKIVIADNGHKIYLYDRYKSIYGNYFALKHVSDDCIDIRWNDIQAENHLMWYIDEAVQVLDGTLENFSCTLEDALRVHEAINTIKNGDK